ncbi:uncharacterized protein N7506_000223 [Penicillium brevicompactum]|uniref:uncharacterized protein n=1 Tax=Penicillium brevicompactum TaxID=5074 RepID=UPI00254016AC|nr:uncharacterized protein N7506_000223 [Penicillium brevicompactum]KAJ5346970.1 hypothetical protein N7506_000223 [Penicillium brevicompactum]
MSTQQTDGGLTNVHTDEHGQCLTPERSASRTNVVGGSVGGAASPDGVQAAAPPRQAQLEAPPEEGQAPVPLGQAQPPAPSVTSAQLPSPSGGLEGDTDMDDAEEPYKPSDSDRRCMIADILSATDDPNTIRRAWEKNIPENCNINYKQLMAILHPDKVPTSEKADAEKAFQSENLLRINVELSG